MAIVNQLSKSLQSRDISQVAEALALSEVKDIELSQQEIDRAILEAKKTKLAEIRRIEYAKRISQPVVYQTPTAEEYLSMITLKGEEMIEGFKLDNHNESIFKLLSQYFTKGKEFEKAGYSLKKGLLIFGNIGCGKTKMLELFKINPLQSYSKINARELGKKFADEGHNAIRYYSEMITKVTVPTSKIFGQRQLGLWFDDVGTEENARFFGNNINPIAEIIQTRYENLSIPYYTVHITTNLTGIEITEKYGDRVKSRMREMFNLISFPEDAPDRRK